MMKKGETDEISKTDFDSNYWHRWKTQHDDDDLPFNIKPHHIHDMCVIVIWVYQFCSGNSLYLSGWDEEQKKKQHNKSESG